MQHQVSQIIHNLIITKGLVFSEPEEGNCSNMCRYRSRYFPISDSTGCGCTLPFSNLTAFTDAQEIGVGDVRDSIRYSRF